MFYNTNNPATCRGGFTGGDCPPPLEKWDKFQINQFNFRSLHLKCIIFHSEVKKIFWGGA